MQSTYMSMWLSVYECQISWLLRVDVFTSLTLLSIFLPVVIIINNMNTASGKVDWKPLQKQLDEINGSYINLEKNEKRLFTQHFDKVYKYVTNSMGERDDLFVKVFQKQQLAGSYADRIKVGQPNEYDALMILNFPDPVVEQSRPGFVRINIKDGIKKKWSTVPEQSYRTLIDENGYLLQDKVLTWLRSLIYEIIKKLNGAITIGKDEYNVKHTSNGPAVTLNITIVKCEEGATGFFSIDFVGALAFDFKKVWFADFEPPILTSKNWNAIVKPNKTISNRNIDWTCSYADMERGYLHDTQTLKQLIRIFKKIRDTHKLTNLKSYYIKVMFLHQRVKHDNEYWKQPLGRLFAEMFDVMLVHLDRRILLSFWHHEYNLFGELEPVQLTDIFNKMKSIKEKIEKNLANKQPEQIPSIILAKEELEQFERTKQMSSNGVSATENVCSVNDDAKGCSIS